MANTFLTPSIIAKEALIVLENNLVFGKLVYPAYSTEFHKVGDTITIRKPAKLVSNVWTSGFNPQDITEGSVAVTLDTLLDVSFEVTSKELTLSIQEFSKQCIEPAMRAHAQKIDSILAGLYYTIPYYVAVDDSTEAKKLETCAGLRRVMNDNKAPFQERSVVVSSSREAAYLVVPSFLNAEKRGDTDALREASLGRIFGFNWYLDQNIVNHTKGGITTAEKITLTKDGDILELKHATAGASTTVKAGDILREGDQTFVILEDKTIPDSNVAVAHYPAVTADVAESTIDEVVDTAGENSLAFHRNAFALVTAPLAKPLGGAASAVETLNGMSIRVVYDYDIGAKANKVSIDLLMGVKTLTEELAVRLID